MSFFEFVSLSGSTTDGVPNPLLLREASFKKKNGNFNRGFKLPTKFLLILIIWFPKLFQSLTREDQP